MIDEPEQLDHRECDHEEQEYLRTDTENAPDSIYAEWRCNDCGARLSYVYEPSGYRIVFPDDGEPYEEDT